MTLRDHGGWTTIEYTTHEVNAKMREDSGWQDMNVWYAMWGWCLLIVVGMTLLCWWDDWQRSR